jgi:hypothetical protein
MRTHNIGNQAYDPSAVFCVHAPPFINLHVPLKTVEFAVGNTFDVGLETKEKLGLFIPAFAPGFMLSDVVRLLTRKDDPATVVPLSKYEKLSVVAAVLFAA